MSNGSGFELIVLTGREERVEIVNRTLRDAGHAAHCRWVSATAELESAFEGEPELLLYDTASFRDPVRAIARIRDGIRPDVPLVIVAEEITERVIAEAMSCGAKDAVSLRERTRLLAVLERELRAFRMELALTDTMDSARRYKMQLREMMKGAADAIGYVHEGIIVDVNPSWLQLFGREDADELVGMPLMDCFAPRSHGPLKGALVAAARGKWKEDMLSAAALNASGEEMPLELALEQADFDGEPCVRIKIQPPELTQREPTRLINDALNRDPTTWFYHRAHFLELLEKRLGRPAESGVRVVAWIRPDSFAGVREAVGLIGSEDVIAQLAELVRRELQPTDFAGRFEGISLLALLERGSTRDAEHWAERLSQKVADEIFNVDGKSTSLTCSIGLSAVTSGVSEVADLVEGAAAALTQGSDDGTSGVYLNELSDADTRIRRYDAIWVERLKEALKENRFRLLRLPIASLDGSPTNMVDILVRMLDEEGEQVLPSEFLPAATRNNMMQAVDRWVVGAALSFCRQTGGSERLFIRLSTQSLLDRSIAAWLKQGLLATGIDAHRLCFQVTEESATQHPGPTLKLEQALHDMGCTFALEHFGAGSGAQRLMQQLTLDYVKIDGSLIQGLAGDEALQAHVQTLVDTASQRDIGTIAERVEDANTMAVLWQLGISFMQGHYVQEPEVILQETA